MERSHSPFNQLLAQALSIVYGRRVSQNEELALTIQLITFLRSSIEHDESAHQWLMRLNTELISQWKLLSQSSFQEWDICSELIKRTDPALGCDMALAVFSGKVNDAGRVTLSTLHSAKGREFEVAILYGVNKYDFPNKRDSASVSAMREARRLFYVGVTRPRKELHLVYEKGKHSPWLNEVYHRSLQK